MVSDSFACWKTKNCSQHALSAVVEVGDLSAFVIEWWGTIGEWSKIIGNQNLRKALSQNSRYYSNVALETKTQISSTF